jgi:L-gulono-1,4-lactone dehydrogenase
MRLPLLLALLFVIPACSPAPSEEAEQSEALFRRSWSNWAGNVRCRPQRIVRPTSAAELQAAVRSAKQVRVAGSGHSWSALACADELMIDTRSLTRVLAVDVAARRITVEAGLRLRELDTVVAQHGLALATAPTIDEITAGGAISTASHGTGLAHGAFSEEVVALEVVDAGGNRVTIDDADRLKAARVGLGALGVIYAITFRLVPAFNLAIDERVVPEDDAFDDLELLLADHQHVDLFWFLTEGKVFLRTYDRTNAPRKVTHPTLNWVEEWIIRTWVAHFGLAIASIIPGLTPILNFAEPFLFRAQSDVDRSDRIFHRFPGHQKVYSMEYVIPIDRTRDALAAIRDALDATGFYPNIPPYLRFVGGGGDGDLSPMRGRDSLAIEVLSYVGFSGWEAFFRDLEPRFIALGGRPHWGKLFYTNPRPLYDAATWTHFEKVRAQLDPGRKFENPLIRAIAP